MLCAHSQPFFRKDAVLHVNRVQHVHHGIWHENDIKGIHFLLLPLNLCKLVWTDFARAADLELFSSSWAQTEVHMPACIDRSLPCSGNWAPRSSPSYQSAEAGAEGVAGAKAAAEGALVRAQSRAEGAAEAGAVAGIKVGAEGGVLEGGAEQQLWRWR